MSYFESLRDDHESDGALALRGIPHGAFVASIPDSQSGSNNLKRVKFNEEHGEFPGYEKQGYEQQGYEGYVSQGEANGQFTFMGTQANETQGYEQQGHAFPYQRTRSATKYTGGKDYQPKSTGVEAYWKDNLPVLEELTFNKVNVQVAVLAPASAPPDMKNQIHIINVKTLRRAGAPWADRAGALEKIFRVATPGAVVVTDAATRDMEDMTSAVYAFGSITILDEGSLPLVAQALGGGIPADTRDRATLFAITFSVHPRNCRSDAATKVDPTQFPAAANTTIFAPVPIDNGRLHPAITEQMITNADKDAILAVYVNSGTDFQPMTISHRTRTPESEAYTHWLDDFKSKTRFEAMAQATQEYVGELVGIQSLSQRIRGIAQNHWDPDAKVMRYSSIQELADQFMTCLNEVDPSNPPLDLPDLADTFYYALNAEMKERVAQDIPAVPAGAPDYSANLGRFMTFKHTCAEEEKRIKQVVNISARINAGRRPINNPVARAPSAGRAFFAGPHMGRPNPFEDTPFGAAQYQTPRYNPPTQSVQHKVASSNNKNITFFNEVVCVPTAMSDMEVAYVTCLSAAEQALAEASGTTKPMKCFGCDQDGHAFRECPKKHDKDTLQNFFKNLKEWKERMKTKRDAERGHYAPTNEESRRRGFMNSRIQAKIFKATRPDLDKKERTELITALGRDIRNAQGPDREIVAGRIQPEGNNIGSFVGYAVTGLVRTNPGSIVYTGTTFAAIEQTDDQVQFAINSLLPFIEFPIGKDVHYQAVLKGLYDTGGCCNMGDLEYHLAICEKFPKLVHSLIELAKVQYEPIKIGGIDGAVKITHILTYYIPYKSPNGEMHTVKIGLTKNLPLNTLYGLPFIIKAKLKADFANHTVTSEYFGDEYAMKMEKPMRVPKEDLDHKNGLEKVFVAAEPTDWDEMF